MIAMIAYLTEEDIGMRVEVLARHAGGYRWCAVNAPAGLAVLVQPAGFRRGQLRQERRNVGRDVLIYSPLYGLAGLPMTLQGSRAMQVSGACGHCCGENRD
jgi:hypothetical protein